MRKDR